MRLILMVFVYCVLALLIAILATPIYILIYSAKVFNFENLKRIYKEWFFNDTEN